MKYKEVTLVVEIQVLVPKDTCTFHLRLMNKRSDFKIINLDSDLDFKVQRFATVNVIDNDNKHSDE
jgi:hypothetical protein